MSKLINEDWEHAAYIDSNIYQLEKDYKIKLNYEHWKYEENQKNKKPAIIKVNKTKNENTYNSKRI